MAGRQQILTGIWNKVSMGAGVEGKKLSDSLVSAVNAYRVDPNPETEAAMHKCNADFKVFWGPLHSDKGSKKQS